MSDEENSHLKQQHEILKYSLEQFDRNVIYVASGSLAVSFAFIKDIIENFNEATYKVLLITSWVFFTSVIFISLTAHLISYMAHTWGQNNYDLEYKEYNKIVRKWNLAIRSMNIISILGIFIGGIFLLIFINKNI